MRHHTLVLKPFLLAVLALIFFTSCSKNPIIKSEFDTDTEGWTITGDAQGEYSDATHAPKGGIKDGGYIFAADNVQGGVWYFTAPQNYLGKKDKFYDAHLKFSLFQDSKKSKQFSSGDIIFKNGAQQITYIHNPENYPGNDWTDYNIKISTDNGWLKGAYNSGVLATEEDIKQVLSNITQFSIRGEFETGPDTGALDNVIITRR